MIKPLIACSCQSEVPTIPRNYDSNSSVSVYKCVAYGPFKNRCGFWDPMPFFGFFSQVVFIISLQSLHLDWHILFALELAPDIQISCFDNSSSSRRKNIRNRLDKLAAVKI